MSTLLTERARAFATAAHAAIGQRRKYTGEPYIVHPADVVKILENYCGTSEHLFEGTIAAAWLHDVVEDTEVTLQTIKDEFGQEVAILVSDLTDVSRPADGNRAERRRIDREHTAESCPAAKTIKLADLISNTKSITAHDPDFAKIYLAEKRLLLEVLKEGDPNLWRIAEVLAR